MTVALASLSPSYFPKKNLDMLSFSGACTMSRQRYDCMVHTADSVWGAGRRGNARGLPRIIQGGSSRTGGLRATSAKNETRVTYEPCPWPSSFARQPSPSRLSQASATGAEALMNNAGEEGISEGFPPGKVRKGRSGRRWSGRAIPPRPLSVPSPRGC